MAGEMAAAKPDNQSLIPMTHVIKGEKRPGDCGAHIESQHLEADAGRFLSSKPAWFIQAI